MTDRAEVHEHKAAILLGMVEQADEFTPVDRLTAQAQVHATLALSMRLTPPPEEDEIDWSLAVAAEHGYVEEN